jgi:ElaA protein
MLNIVWECKFFDELSNHQLYQVIRLRNEVFVVEQSCVFQDADNKDQECFHLMGWVENDLAAYARLVPPNVIYKYVSIGRIITSHKYRKFGAGKALLAEAISKCNTLFGKQQIKIGAQAYLRKFYNSFGFEQINNGYLEDGIPHIEMLRASD